MHHDIAEFPSQFFYEGLLTEVPLKHQLRPLPKYNNDTDNIYNNIVQQSRMSFIDVMPDSTSHSDKINVAEARTVALIVKEIYHREGAAYSTDSIGIIVPYRNQIATIRKEIECLGIATLGDICIDTVERYQGSQKRYIIYSFTISKPYQLTFLTENSFEENGMIIDRKLNVALTRAKESMIIVGNATLLGSYPLYKRLIEFIASRGGLYRL
jgi:superfamily I DNA and/or RNA helicase